MYVYEQKMRPTHHLYGYFYNEIVHILGFLIRTPSLSSVLNEDNDASLLITLEIYTICFGIHR